MTCPLPPICDIRPMAGQGSEFVHIIKGRITITPDGGAAVVLGPGDAFVVEPDFKGTWKIEETIRKHFAIKL
jgi:uncharacterized protein